MNILRMRSRCLTFALCLCGTTVLAQAPSPKVSDPQPSPVPPEGAVVPAPQGRLFFAQPNQTPNLGEAGPNVIFSDPNQSANFFRSNPTLAYGALPQDPGKYWIGLLCVDAGDALRQQLGLEVGVGLLVEAVTDDGPAKKAGIQKNDVVIATAFPVDEKAESKPLTQVMQLIEAVQKAEKKPLRLTLVRRGQKQTVDLEPAERPQAQAAPLGATLYLEQAEKQLQHLLQTQRQQAADQADRATKEAERARDAVKALDQRLHEQRLGMRLAGPMFLTPPTAPKLPDGMSMEFHQVVGQPEQIIVRKGDQKWVITVEQLDKLPEDVRNEVQQQLAFRHGFPGAGNIAVPGMHGIARSPLTARVAPPIAVESRIVATARLPEDLSVTVTRKGSEPAHITVKQKDQSWEITEAELDKLPPDVRKHVEPLLPPRNPWTATRSKFFGSPADGVGASGPPGNVPRTPQLAPSPPSASETQIDRQLQERQETMLKQLKELTEKVEKLQQALEKSSPKQ